MTERDPREALAAVMRRTGVAFPRGVLGAETARLARAISDGADGDEDLDALVDDAADVLWPELQPSTLAFLERHAALADEADLEDLERVRAWARDPDPSQNPLARALCVRAAQELAAATARAEAALVAAETSIAAGQAEGALAAASALGVVVVELLDLDPDDFADEIVAFVEADESPEALDRLARATGDDDTRGWARTAAAALARVDSAPHAAAAMAALTDGPPPEDPARDAVWVPTMLALVQQGFERAYAAESANPR